VASPWDDLTLAELAPGRYATTITDAWVVMTVPQGGFLGLLAAEAMRHHLADDTLALRTFTVVFAAPVQAGPVEIDVTELRRGRSAAQLSVTVRNIGRDSGATAVAVFGRTRAGFSFTDAAPPVVLPPEECWSYREPPDTWRWDGPMSPFWNDVLHGRNHSGAPPWQPPMLGAAETLIWYRFDVPPPPHPFASALVLSDAMPSTVEMKVGEGAWFAPSADLTVHVVGQPRSEWLLSHATCRWAGDGYASADADLWDMDAPGGPTLVAHATQVMLFTFFD
jgi:acyl-CoA thioesterase